MARGPQQQLTDRSSKPAAIRPDYHVILDISGGMNTSKPPDQIADNESPDMQNLVYVNKVLCVDFGFKAIGSPVVGMPLQPIEWNTNQGIRYILLVTTKTVYQWSQGSLDWIPIVSGAAVTVNGTVNGNGNNPAVAFTGAATWITGQLLGVITSSGKYIVGAASGTTSPVTIGAPLATGVSIANGVPLFPMPTFTSAGNKGISWAGDPVRNTLQFVNGYDPVQEFNGTNCVPLAGLSGINLSTANALTRYHNILVLGGTVEGGIQRPYRIRRSATGDSTNWTTLDSGFDDLTDTSDAILGLELINPTLAVIRDESIVRATYYGIGAQVFWYDYGISTVGSIGAQSFTTNRLNEMIVMEPGVFLYGGDQALTDVGDKIFNAFISYAGELSPTAEDVLLAQYVPLLDETWLLFADQNATFPNKIWRYSHKNGTWFRRVLAAPLQITGAGLFRPQAANRWVDLVGTRWIDRHKAWNSRSNLTNYHAVLLCGSTGQVYLYDFNKTTTDAGNPIVWYFVSKDYPLPEAWETLDGLVFYGKGIVNLVEISTDYGKTWHQLGSNITLGPTWARGDLDCSLTCEFVRVRFSGNDPSFKLSWFAFKTMYASER